MHTLLSCSLIITLLIIAYQDFKSREVHWFLFPLLLILSLSKLWYIDQLKEVFSFLINVLMVLVQLLLLTFYFSVKEKKLINIADNYLGWGDILFLFNLCFLLSPVNFILFYLVSLLATIICFLVYKAFVNTTKPIPLAGLQALIFTIVYIIDLSSPNIDLLNDFTSQEVLKGWIT
ncbi:Type IV leader peptidase family protein [compost metagenome]